MQRKQGIVLVGALVALAGIGAALIMAMGAPSQNPSAANAPGGAAPPPTNPNSMGSAPETSTAGDTTGNSTGSSTANQSQSGATTSGGTTGGLYG